MMNAECRTTMTQARNDSPAPQLRSAFGNLRFVPLLLLTILAGAIRFTRIDHPPLWYDESMVFWRTCGTYGQLLDCLRTDGFVPLHYSLVWVITRFFRPTPLVLRLVPALCGTLMVPAVYFLAKQLLPRKTSLLAAAFTACSAFTLFYSRDAKMYMDAWLFVTLNIGCLLWWFRTKSTTAWLCWIACGAAACGLQITSAIPVALSLLLLFTQDKMRWQQTLLWLLGVLLIAAGPIGHYEKFNIWIDRVEEDGWAKSQLQWINAYNSGRSGPELLRYLGSTMIMGWEWPRSDAVAPATAGPPRELKHPWFSPFSVEVPSIPRERFTIPATVAEFLLAMLAAGCLPWPRRWRDRSGVIDTETAPQPQWRVLLWLLLLVVLPVYGFYCRSMPGFAGPVQWCDWLRQTLSVFARSAVVPPFSEWKWVKQIAFEFVQGYWIGLLMLLLISGQVYLTWRDGLLRPMLLRGICLSIVIATVYSICWGMAIAMAAQAKAAAAAGKPWESLWVPRYMGFIWPVFAIAVSALIMRLPTRPVRVLAITFLLGINLAVASFRIFGPTEPPVDVMARDTITAQDPSHHTMIRMDIDHGEQYPGGGNLFSGPGEYYLDMLSKTPVDPPHFKTAIGPRERATRGGFSIFGPVSIPPSIDRLIVWNQYEPNQHLPAEELLPRLAGWKLVSDTQFEARDCWIWADIAKYRRREYVRNLENRSQPPQHG
jgi:4-amino-4-deoxy-L-arabinose transferase-like glycosyltransferase